MNDYDDRSNLMVEVNRAISRTLKVPIGGAPGGYQAALAKTFPITGYKQGDVPPSWNGADPGIDGHGADLPFNQIVLVDNVRRATSSGRSALGRLDAMTLSEDAHLRSQRIRTVFDDLDRAVARDDGPLPEVVDSLHEDLEKAVHGDTTAAVKPFRDLLVGTDELPTPSEGELIELVIALLMGAKTAIKAAWDAYRAAERESATANDRARLILAALIVENASEARRRFAVLGVGATESEAHWLPGADRIITVDGFLDAAEELGSSVPALLATLGHEAVPGITIRATRLHPLASGAAGHTEVRDAALRDALTDLSRALDEIRKPRPQPVIGPVTLVPWPGERTAAAGERTATAIETISATGLAVKTGKDAAGNDTPLQVKANKNTPVYVRADEDEPVYVKQADGAGGGGGEVEATPATRATKATKTKEGKGR